jgi:hypothetical protein
MIRYSTTIASPLPPQTSRSAVLGWLQAIGYRLTSPAFLSSVSMERGSWVGNMGSLAPKTWSAKVYVTFKATETGCDVTLEWHVSTFGQIGTKADIHFWRSEIEWTLGAACGIMPDLRDYVKEASRAYNGNVWRALVFSAALIVPLIVMAVATQSILITIFVSLVTGTASGLAFRMPRDLGEISPPKPATAAPPVAR